ncbi:MAG: phosphomannomutase/phosphoglucomutase [Candidatus Gracilibacteria bacterium]|jgi:phosphomannomutase/phosphoglucomutase
MDKNIFRAYDIRGVDLTQEVAYQIGLGAGTYLKQKYQVKNMAVGRDNRLSGKMLHDTYVKGLLETGINVTSVGLAISPLLYWSVCAMPFDSATNITASHNPKEYNGFKIVTKNAHSICGDELQEIYNIIDAKKFEKSQTPGQFIEKDFRAEYLKDLASRVKISRKLKVVVDTGNGTAGIFAPEFLRMIGCDVIELYTELNGNFPNHEANPEELKNMEDLILKVKSEKADLGIGFDGDGDRVGVVDEKGKLYSSDFMLLLLTKDLLKRVENPQVVFDIKVSKMIINRMKELGAIPVMSKTGHSFIEAKMKELNAPLAGEVSGHLFFGENYYGFDDAMLAAAKIIEIIAAETHPLSQMFNDLPKSYMTPELKAACPDDKKFEIVQKVTDYFLKKYDCITIDGVRVNFSKTSWGAVRASNTSPNLTLRFEATTEEELEDVQEIMAAKLREFPDVNLDWFHPYWVLNKNDSGASS